MRVAAARGDEVLLIAHGASLGQRLGFAVGARYREQIGWRWVSRGDVTAAISPLPDGRVWVDSCVVLDGFEVCGETPDTVELLHDQPTPRPDLVTAGFEERYVEHRRTYVYVQTFVKSDPRLGGFAGLVEHAGYRLRVIERRPGEARVVADRLIADLLGLERTEHTARGWVADRGDAAPRPLLDDAVLARLKRHNRVRYAPIGRELSVAHETADALTLTERSGTGEDPELKAAGFHCEHSTSPERYGDVSENYDHTLEVPKLDGRITGPFERWVTYRGVAVRALVDSGDHVLVVAHPALGRTLGFADVRPGGDHIHVSCRWAPRHELTSPGPDGAAGVRTASRGPALASGRSLTLAEIDAHAHIAFATPERTLLVIAETASSLELLADRAWPDDELIAAGFTCDAVEVRDDRYDPLVTHYLHRHRVDKLDRRVIGPFASWRRHGPHLLRVIAEEPDRVLVVCHDELGATLGFASHRGERWSACGAWLYRSAITAV